MIGIEAFIGQTSTGEKPPKPELTTKDVIIPGYNSAESDDTWTLQSAESVQEDTYEKSYFKEVGDLIPNLAEQAVYDDIIAEPEHRDQVVESFARAVEIYSEPLTDEHKHDIAERALKAFRRHMPASQVVQRLAKDNRAAHQLVAQRTKELEAAHEDTHSLESQLKSRKVALLNDLAEAGPSGERSEQIISELQFIQGLLERRKTSAAIVDLNAVPVPTTDELHEMVSHVTHESVSPGRGHDFRVIIAEQALRASNGLHHLADVVLPEGVPVE